MVDGGFFLKRLPSLLSTYDRSVDATAKALVQLCRSDVEWLTGERSDKSEKAEKRSAAGSATWLHHVYRIFFYDARPYDGKSQHPFTGKPLDFAKSDAAEFRNQLFDRLRRQRKLALRLGTVIQDGDWRLPARSSHAVLKTKALLANLRVPDDADAVTFSGPQLAALRTAVGLWSDIGESEPHLSLRQKGVDMRLGLDIAAIALKRLSDTIILIAGDSDFVPAAKLARREGVEIVLDPMWQEVSAELFEHIDGVHCGLPRPRRSKAEAATGDDGPTAQAEE